MGGRAVVAALLLAGWSGLVAAQEPTPAVVKETPVLRVEQSNLDLGTIRAGQEAVGTFVFHNDGTTVVKIIRAKPS
jgi:hypothetical protein